MTNKVDIFTRDQAKAYAVVDRDSAAKQMRARALALMADALREWISHARGNISRHSTKFRYLESLYIDVNRPSGILIDVIPDTLADIVEYGQSSFYLSPVIAGATKKGGPKYKARPMLFGGADREYVSPKEGPGYLSVSSKGALDELNSGADPEDVSPKILMAVSGWERVAASAKDFKPAGTFIKNATSDTEFRVLTPADTWKHPGVRAILASEHVEGWITRNRESYTQGMFEIPHMYEL